MRFLCALRYISTRAHKNTTPTALSHRAGSFGFGRRVFLENKKMTAQQENLFCNERHMMQLVLSLYQCGYSALSQVSTDCLVTAFHHWLFQTLTLIFCISSANVYWLSALLIVNNWYRLCKAIISVGSCWKSFSVGHKSDVNGLPLCQLTTLCYAVNLFFYLHEKQAITYTHFFSAKASFAISCLSSIARWLTDSSVDGSVWWTTSGPTLN